MHTVFRLTLWLCAVYGLWEVYLDVQPWFRPMAGVVTQSGKHVVSYKSDIYDAYVSAEYGPDTSSYQVHTIDACGSMADNLGVVFMVNRDLPDYAHFELWIPTTAPYEAEVRVMGEGTQHRIPLKNIPIRIFRRHQPTSIAHVTR